MLGTGDEKASLRRVMLGARDALAPETRESASLALVKHVKAARFQAVLPEAGGIIAGFMPMRSEISPLPLMAALAQDGFRLALPRITPEGLVFHGFEMGAALAPGPFGTREPLTEAPLVTPNLFLTPLLAFDGEGGRLGYGKGYYDRVFAQHPSAKRVGVAYAMQEVAKVPREAHDALLDMVLTEA